jgi:hypothetical protein
MADAALQDERFLRYLVGGGLAPGHVAGGTDVRLVGGVLFFFWPHGGVGLDELGHFPAARRAVVAMLKRRRGFGERRVIDGRLHLSAYKHNQQVPGLAARVEACGRI